MVAGVGLLVEHLFHVEAFRKLYFDIPGFNLHQVSSAVERFLTVEVRLVGYHFFDGRYWDRNIYSITAADFGPKMLPTLDRLLGR